MDYQARKSLQIHRMRNKPEHSEEQPKQHTIRIAGKRGDSKK